MRFKPPEGRAPVCQRAVAHEGVKMDACSNARVLPAPASVGLASGSVVPVGAGVVLLSAAPPSTVATVLEHATTKPAETTVATVTTSGTSRRQRRVIASA